MKPAQREWSQYHRELEDHREELRDWERGGRIGPEPTRPARPRMAERRSTPPPADPGILDNIRRREITPEWSCHGKEQYTARRVEVARAAAERRYGVPMRTYHCPFCNRYHLTKKKPGRSRR